MLHLDMDLFSIAKEWCEMIVVEGQKFPGTSILLEWFCYCFYGIVDVIFVFLKVD